MSTHPLAGVMLKIARAEQQLVALDQSIQGFFVGDFYTTFTDKDRQGRVALRVDEVHETPPAWSVTVGEIVYNLRSSLDHLAFALARAHTIPLPEAVQITSAFPIFAKGPEFRRKRAKGPLKGQPAPQSGLYKIRGVGPKARALIESLQPYHRRKNPDTKRLRELDELSNVDKHRALHVVVAQSVEARHTITGNTMYATRRMEVFNAIFEPKAMLARFELWPDRVPDLDVQVKTQNVVDVMFDRRTPSNLLRGQPVLEMLYAISSFVTDGVVIPLAPLVSAADPPRFTFV